MVKGTRVGWTLLDGRTGQGTTVSDEDGGKILVAMDPQPGSELHFVICCTVTWLTVLP